MQEFKFSQEQTRTLTGYFLPLYFTFQVISLVNLTLSEMRTAMLAFCCLLGELGNKQARNYQQIDAILSQLNFSDVLIRNKLTCAGTFEKSYNLIICVGRGVYGVVYYAGHGYEDNGENYLLPVDSDIKYNREHSLRTQEILEAMQQCDTSLNLLIIDACRVR